jgi:hypothetical protein
MAKKQAWKMPAWMEPYRDLIQNTGGNSVEELVNDTDSNMHNNCIRAALCIAVKSQVTLLRAMHDRAMLAEIVKPAPLVRRSISG